MNLPALSRRHCLALALPLPAATLLSACATASAPAAPALVELQAAGGRAVAVTVWRPRGAVRGRVLFSHGAASAPAKYTALLEPWVGAGWEVWAPLHVDSTEHPQTARYPGMASWAARLEDMRLLADHVGPGTYVAAGHSYGALVALVLGGATPQQVAAIGGTGLRDPRVRAVIAFSPPGPLRGLIDGAGYAGLAVPALIETGDLDVPPGAGPGDWVTHLAAYDAAAPGGERYALVLAGANHYFGGLICRLDLPGPRQDAALAAAVRVSTVFLQAFGAGDAAARARLGQALAADGPVRLQRK